MNLVKSRNQGQLWKSGVRSEIGVEGNLDPKFGVGSAKLGSEFHNSEVSKPT